MEFPTVWGNVKCTDRVGGVGWCNGRCDGQSVWRSMWRSMVVWEGQFQRVSPNISSFPSALEISSALGEATATLHGIFGIGQWKNLGWFLPPELGERCPVGLIARFVVPQRPKIFLAWQTVLIGRWRQDGREINQWQTGDKVVEKLIAVADRQQSGRKINCSCRPILWFSHT